MVFDQKLYVALEADKRDLQEQIFSHPPKTMEEFHHRLGKWEQITATMSLMVEMATKDDQEKKDML